MDRDRDKERRICGMYDVNVQYREMTWESRIVM